MPNVSFGSKAAPCGRGQFESPTPSKNDASSPEQVGGAIIAAPPVIRNPGFFFERKGNPGFFIWTHASCDGAQMLQRKLGAILVQTPESAAATLATTACGQTPVAKSRSAALRTTLTWFAIAVAMRREPDVPQPFLRQPRHTTTKSDRVIVPTRSAMAANWTAAPAALPSAS